MRKIQKTSKKITTKRVQFSKNVKWLEPFFYSAEGLIPLEKVSSVKGYSIPLDKEVQTYANIHKVGKKYRITLNLKENNVLSREQLEKHVGLVLEDFAHEMAHINEWEHDYKHFALTARIMIRFSKVLKVLNWETDLPFNKLV